MKLKRILGLALIFAAAISMFLVRDSVAWIDTSTGVPLGQEITASNMFFEFNGNLGTDLKYENLIGADGVTGEFIIPGQNLIADNGGKLTATNYSTIETEIRVLVEYDKYDKSNSTMYKTQYTGTGDDIVVEFGGGWSKGAADNYFYPASILPALSASQAAEGEGDEFDIINGIYYDVDDSYKALDADITITIQAKQADHVSWSTLRTWVASLP